MIIPIIAAVFLAVFFILEVTVDEKEIRQMRNLQHRLMTIAKKQCEKSVGVIVEADKSAESTIEFIEHLLSFGYDKLKVIIIVNKTIDKAARLRIADYLRINNLSDIRIVNRTKNTAVKNILSRNLSVQLVIILNENDRLSKNFFSEASIESFGSDVTNVVLPRHQISLSNTLASLFQAHFVILRQLKARMFGVRTVLSPLRSGVIYSREAILSDAFDQKPIRLNISPQMYLSKKIIVENMLDYLNYKIDKAVDSLKNWMGILTFFAVAGVFVASLIFLKPSDLLLAVLLVLFAYVLSSVFMQIRMKGYSFTDNINLFLIAPIGLLFEAAVYILGFVKLIFSFLVPKPKPGLSDQGIEK